LYCKNAKTYYHIGQDSYFLTKWGSAVAITAWEYGT